MWRNPKYAPPDPRPAPEPSGRLLAAISRPGGRFGPDAELRVVLDEYQQRPYISVRLWTKGQDGTYWPSKKGVSVRIGEAKLVAAALIEAAQLASSDAVPSRADRRDGGKDRRA